MKFGITERGDAGLDFEWENKLDTGNILITKCLNDEFISRVIKYKDKVIIHVTCTGYGNTVVEPNVHTANWTLSQFIKLIKKGFPINQTVLRVDPIIPTDKGIRRAEHVLRSFEITGIERVRYSFLDMYPHVKERFINAGLPLPYTSFMAPKHMRDKALQMLSKFENIYKLEACCEQTSHAVGCISKKDFDILGIPYNDKPSGYQRKGCLCISGKHELLSSVHRCDNKCLYCYWKD